MQEMKKKYVNRRIVIPALLLAGLMLLIFIRLFSAEGLPLFGGANVVIETNDFRYEVAGNGKNLHFIDKVTGADYLNTDSVSRCAYVVKNGKQYPASAVSLSGDTMKLEFKEAGVTSVMLVNQTNDRATFKVASLSGEAELLTFINVPLKLEGMPDEPFAACVLSMNIFTHVRQLPALQTHLWATAYSRFGIEGAEITLLGLPSKNMLPVIREVMKNAKDIPFSDAGGAWAQQSKEGYGSYLMNFGTLTEETVDEWIAMCNNLGFTQIDNHGRSDFFRFGDFELDRKKWPDGWDTFKRINKRLHDAGISSIFHTYAFFIDKNSKYVTPVPREDLGYFRTFTIEKPIDENDSVITVKESTENVSLITGFFERNSVTLRIGNELIEFSGVTKTPSFQFAGCRRGALGTKASSHQANEQAFHLREMFNRFVPGVETPLFSEIAEKTAEIVDQAGFDGIYFDAIDGSDILAGPQNFWYYGGKFVFETAKHLKRPVGMEMSSMIHHWWHYRSRWQAWDRPVRGYKRFVDIHCASIKSDEYEHGLWRGNTPMINKLAPAENGGLMLPLQLGWWAHQTWNPPLVEATFTDDIEYLACKMIGNNAGLAMLGGFDKKTLDEFPAFNRLNAIIKQYEELRHQNYFNDSIRKLLRAPGKEFTLFRTPDNEWNFKPVSYQKHKVAGLDHPSANWSVVNEFEPQPVKLRIEALMSVKAWDDTANIVLSDFSGEVKFKPEELAAGVTGELKISGEKTPSGEAAVIFTANSTGKSPREASWVKMQQNYEPLLNLSGNQALGIWVKGDGNGELLNLRIESPHHISHGARGDHFIMIDFTGWKYFELVEIESSEFSNYIWPAPYSSSSFYVYDSYRHTVSFDKVDKLQLWYNNLPAGKTVTTLLGPVKALPLVINTITNPTITIRGEKITFPVSLKSGMYLEFKSASDCKLFGSKGEFIRDVPVQGKIPMLDSGSNNVSFTCDRGWSVRQRVQVTIIGEGEVLAE